MTKLAPETVGRLSARYPGAIDRPLMKRLVAPGVTLLICAYLVSCFFTFNLAEVLGKARGDMVRLFALDAYAYKVHVQKRFGNEGYTFALEGSRYTTYDTAPDWVSVDGENAKIDLGNHGRVVIADKVLEYSARGEPPYRIAFGDGAPRLLEGTPPEWMRVSDIQIDMRPGLHARIWITKSKIEIHRYFLGWEHFWFDFNSPLRDMSLAEVASLAVSGDRIDPAMPNWRFIFCQFWGNQEWQHGEVFYALLQTVVMAVVGTLVAGILALPLAFAAANTINASQVVRFGLRRVFDFLRGIDTLIWSLIFIRAFGLGPLSGIFAIFFTDTGTFGKLFSEAVENADRKQAEGVQATGASPVQTYRFGVFPQILPVFISQLLYYLESNTRSATVIGALGAGGIGLKLLETMRTRQDWENTLYIITLVIAVVILMDNLSGWLRRRLIEG